MTNPRDHAHHPSHVPAAEATDSAGMPWARRDLSPSGFEGDTGISDPVVLAALGGSDEEAMMAALASARFLVAVVAHADEIVTGDDGLVHDASVDMALVTLVAPDGRRALPAFTGLTELTAWDASARPVTKPSRVKAVAAMFGTELTVIWVSETPRRQPSSVLTACRTSATGSGSAAARPGATPPATQSSATAPAPIRRRCTTRRA